MIDQINELLIAVHTYEQQSSNQIKRADVQTYVATCPYILTKQI